MLFAARVPVSVGVVQWPAGVAATVVVKRSFDLGARGGAVPSRLQEPLGLERRDGSGALLHPSDFAPTKALCDVAVVGAALLDPEGPVRIVVGDLRRLVERAALLGPRPSPGPLGDPSDPSLAGDWTHAAFDFERFQWAGREQRLPIPSLPLDVVVDVGPRRSAVRLEGPAPVVLLVDETGWTAPRPVLVRLDGIALDLARQRIDLVWRGLVELAPGSRPLLVVDPSGSPQALSALEVASWPRSEAVEPAVLRRLAARRAQRDTVPLDVVGAPRASPSMTAGVGVRPGDEVLPFAASGTPPVPVPVPVPAPVAPPSAVGDERRATIAFEVPADLLGADPGSTALPFVRAAAEGDGEDPLARTVARIGPASGPALPFVAEPAARAQRRPAAEVIHDPAALPFPAAATPPPRIPSFATAVALAPTPWSTGIERPAAVSPPGPPAVVAPTLDPATFARIKASLWSGEVPREEALAAHGLTELEWRLAERRFARSIGKDAESGAVRLVVERLRGELARRPG